MRRNINFLLAVVVSFALASPLYAQGLGQTKTFHQNEELQSGNTDSISRQTQIGLTSRESVNQLMGRSLIAEDGENLGRVADMRIDTRTGRIDYVVVEREDALGVGESVFVPVPLAALSYTGQDARLLVDKTKLRDAPSPGTMSAQEFQQDLHSHYGVAPTWEIERRTTIEEERRTVTP